RQAEKKAKAFTPAAGESEESFKARCVKAATSEGASEADASKACQAAWDSSTHKPSPPGQPAPASAESRAAQAKQMIARFNEKFGRDPSAALIARYSDEDLPDIPAPEEGESREDFVDRCVDEISGDGVSDEDAEYACEMQYEDQGDTAQDYSDIMEDSGAKGLVTKTHASTETGMEFILSDATPDRFGDIVEPSGWDFRNFQRNPIALFNHDPSFVVGSWKGLGLKNNALRGHLVLAPKDASPRINEIRA